jgi:hypothetical protein
MVQSIVKNPEHIIASTEKNNLFSNTANLTVIKTLPINNTIKIQSIDQQYKGQLIETIMG